VSAGHIVPSCWEREAEGGSLSWFRFHPEPPAVTVHDFFADRQANACACVLIVGVQASEHLEDVILELGVDTDAIIVHRQPMVTSVST
jgi:hypothetical protein